MKITDLSGKTLELYTEILVGSVDSALFVECRGEFDFGPVCAFDGE
jgi:hypothetical protein